MENIKNNTQPSVEQLEKLSLEGLSDNTIKLLNLSIQMLRMENEIRSVIFHTNCTGKITLVDDNVESFDNYASNLLSTVNILIINDILG